MVKYVHEVTNYQLKDRLRALREEKKFSAAQLAGAFEKSEGAVRMWETGRSKPDADTLIRLAKYFDCTTDYLLGLSDIKNEEVKKYNDETIQKLIDLNNRMSNFPIIKTFADSLEAAVKYQSEKILGSLKLYDSIIFDICNAFQSHNEYIRSTSDRNAENDILKSYMALASNLSKYKERSTDYIDYLVSLFLNTEMALLDLNPSEEQRVLIENLYDMVSRKPYSSIHNKLEELKHNAL